MSNAAFNHPGEGIKCNNEAEKVFENNGQGKSFNRNVT
jgi:hypothetical protein